MTVRPLAKLATTYLSALVSNLEQRAQSDPALEPFVEALASIDPQQDIRGPRPELDHPAMAHLATALRNAAGDPALVPPAMKAAEALDWLQLYGGGGVKQDIAEGMLAAQVAGSYGCFPSDTVATGQFLLAPGLHYPLHTHAATEIYYCLSGTLTLQHGVDGSKFEVPAGAYSITPSHRLHALWTGDAPVLLLYAWIGDVGAPIWIWEQNENADWNRSAWTRPAGKPWQIDRTEPVTAERMAEAHP